MFRPLEPIDVPEHQPMTMTIPEASMVPSEEDVGLEAVRQALSKIPGSLTADFLAERAEP